MTLSLALNNALSGLQANTQQAEIISTNVANALTDGFGRREVSLSSLGATGGVKVDGVIRASSPALAESRRFADAAASGADTRSDALARLSAAIGEPGAPRALATVAADFDAALSAAADTPESATLLSFSPNTTNVFLSFNERLFNTLTKSFVFGASKEKSSRINTLLSWILYESADLRAKAFNFLFSLKE